MNTQRGMTTLLITSMLLSAALILTLASYRSVFYQIKLANNEVAGRQQFWQAQGALECAMSVARQQQFHLSQADLTVCQSQSTGELSIEQHAHQRFALSAQVGFAHLFKTLQLATMDKASVVSASSALYFAQGLRLTPDPGERHSAQDWPCSIVRYRSELRLQGDIRSLGLADSWPPYRGFSAAQPCRTGYQTDISLAAPFIVNASTASSGLGKDIVFDDQLEPFNALFATPRSQWYTLMARSEFHKLAAMALTDSSGAMLYEQAALPAPSLVSDCGEQLRTAVAAGHDLLWVYGSCHLDRDDLLAIEQARVAAQGSGFVDAGLILLVHNGVFSVAAQADSPAFYGLIYQFIDEQYDLSAAAEVMWAASSSAQQSQLQALMAEQTDIDVAHVGYLQSGEFAPVAGMILDAPGYFALFAQRLAITLDRDVINAPLARLRAPRWRAGSWYAK